MELMSFIMSLSSQSSTSTPPEPPAEVDLVLSDEYVEFTGTQLRLDAGTASGNTHFFYRPRMTHVDGKTYFNYNDLDSVLPWQQSRLLVFDNQRGFDIPRQIGQGRSGADTHGISTVVIDSGRVYSIQEDLHDSPLRVLKSAASSDYGFFTLAFSIGTVLSYAHFVKRADGNWLVFSRGIAQPTANYYTLHITQASAGFETWGTPLRISARPTGQDPFLRHYPALPWGRASVGGKIYLVFSARKDDAGAQEWWYRHHIMTTPDTGADCGRVFSNVEGTFSHDYDVDGDFTDAQAATNFAYLTMDTDTTTAYPPAVGIGPGGEVYTVVPGTDGTGYYFKYFIPGDGWTSKEITIANLESPTTGVFAYITAYSRNKIRVVVRIQDGSFVRPHWFETTNEGTTWTDLGDMRPAFTGTIYPLIPENFLEIADDENFAMLFSRSDTVYTGGAMLHCTIAAKGSIQNIPGVEVVAASDMNYSSTGMFHYKNIAANLSLSGTNVLAKTDLFGLRNITAFNNPQFPGTDYVTTNGTNSSMSIASVAGLAAMTSMVFMVVGRAFSGLASSFLVLSDATSTTEYMEFGITAAGFPYHRITNSATLVSTSGQSVDDSADHVITYIITGLTVYIRVDGKLTYVTNSATTANHLLQDGDAPNVITTITSANIGVRNLSAGDIFTQTRSKEECCWSGVMPTSEIMAREKKMCTDHGITFLNQFQIP